MISAGRFCPVWPRPGRQLGWPNSRSYADLRSLFAERLFSAHVDIGGEVGEMDALGALLARFDANERDLISPDACFRRNFSLLR
jgi:hypothetical protein